VQASGGVQAGEAGSDDGDLSVTHTSTYRSRAQLTAG
jgi:hypothetical protein